eukprot:gene28845-34814_t
MDKADIERYLSRIGYEGGREPTLDTLRELQLQHNRAVPFENLNRHLGRDIFVNDLAVLKAKVFDEKRGGYCFELNQLFFHLLIALGFQVDTHLARILWEVPPDQSTGLTHLMIIAHIDSKDYLVDVGAGPIGCPVPLHIHTQAAVDTEYGQHRVVQVDAHTYVHELLNAHGEWKGSYVFNTSMRSVVPDYVIGSYYVSTHPASFFSHSIMVAAFTRSNDRCVLFNTDFTRRNATGVLEKYEVTTKEEYARLLKEVFGLPIESLLALKVPGKDWDFHDLAL